MKTTAYILTLLVILLSSCSKTEPFPEREGPVDSAIVNPEVGGPNEPNQVYINFDSNETSSFQRDSWDLGFYCGEPYRVKLNGSIYMATKALDYTNIDLIDSSDVEDVLMEVGIATFDPYNINFVDDFDGDINNTAIDEISLDLEDNKVYLLNLGYEVGEDTPDPGTVAVSGEHRGWKKIRIIRNDDNYILQYADIESTTHQEVEIEKDTEFNFVYFSFNTNSIVKATPKKNKWDILFTVFTNEIPGYGTYGYTDFVVSNRLDYVEVYMVNETDISYEAFLLSHVVNANFESSQRGIGKNWRAGGGPGVSPHVLDDVYFILKDTEGIIYKIKFITMINTNGERGYPQFQYKLL